MLGVPRALVFTLTFSLLFLLNFISFLLDSLHYKVACLVAHSFLQPMVCLLSFQVASGPCNDFVKESF